IVACISPNKRDQFVETCSQVDFNPLGFIRGNSLSVFHGREIIHEESVCDMRAHYFNHLGEWLAKN
ncbi:MAG: hypothetical protein KC505_04460, partial [Myxococcales bacterium]|nr:hypothetical protein [Myxococcales bacterium]